MKIEDYHKQRIGNAVEQFTLAECQLLLLGLWVVGEENRVDPTMTAQFGWLLNALNHRAALIVNAAVAGVPVNNPTYIKGDALVPNNV